MGTFVLVHGAWHGGWAWDRVAPLLRQAGYTVRTPTLTGLAELSNLLTRDVGVETHVSDIVDLIEREELNDVVLVGHSYGGIVITGAGSRVPERIRNLVFLDAIVLQPGKAYFDLQVPENRDRFIELANKHGDGWRIPPPDASDFGLTSQADVDWVNSRLTDQPISTNQQPVDCACLEWDTLRKIYVRCTVGAPSAAAMAAAAREDPRWEYHELETGHSPMFTMPARVAETLLRVATINRED